MTTAKPNNLTISKEWLKPYSPCTEGYKWFLENFPQGGQFAEVYAALRKDRKYDDADWLSQRVFEQLDTPLMVQQTCKITGADAVEIAKLAAENQSTGNYANSATTGEGSNSATTGAKTVSASVGRLGMAKAGQDGCIIAGYWDDENDRPRVVVGYVGEDGIKSDTWYKAEAGKLIEVQE